MATKLRRSLYIGLGGTGMNAILKTKKMFIDNYGEVPPMIGFLGIDTDNGVYSKTEITRHGEVSLDRSEQCSISVPDPRNYFNIQRDNLRWLPDENSPMIQNLDRGAGQVRTNGRLSFIYNKERLSNAIQNAYAKITSNTIVDDIQYEVLAEAKTEVHVICSVCGGTGAGTFIDIAYLLHHLYNSHTRTVNVNGYAVLPDVFCDMVRTGNAMAKTKPNAYGSIADVDFLMHLTPTSTPVKIEWLNDSFTTNMKPFDAFYFVDNKNDEHTVYEHVDDLAEMISLALVSAAGQVGTEVASVSDNVEKCMIEGDLNVGNKIAWVSRIGASDIVFKGDEIAEIFALKAIQRMIQMFNNTVGDIETEANSWIDGPNVNIREKDADHVIDFLLEKQPKSALTEISDCTAPQNEINTYMDSILNKANNDAKGKREQLSGRVSTALSQKVNELLNRGVGGIYMAKSVLNSIKSQVEIFKGEMVDEHAELEDKKTQMEQQIKIFSDDLCEYQKKLLKIGKRKEEKINDVLEAVSSYAKNCFESIRRAYAQQFFNSLLSEIDVYLGKIDNLLTMMSNIENDCVRELARISNKSIRTKTIEIDLAEEIAGNISVGDSDIVLQDFTNQVNGCSMLNVANTEQLKGIMFNYVQGLTTYKAWKEKTIDDVINDLPDETFTQVVKRAMSKSIPFMRIDPKGHVTNQGSLPILQAINHYYYVCLPDITHSRFTINDNFKNMNDSNLDISFISTGLSDRIIIYRQDGTVPAFTIDGIESYHRAYEKCGVSSHFDALIKQRMDNENFDINPKDYSSDAVEYWTLGFIFGLIKYDERTKTYHYNDPDKGRALNNYWVDTNERYRDLAFAVFTKHVKRLGNIYEKDIDNQVEKMGLQKYEELIADIKENYFDKYSQCPISYDSLLYKHDYEKTRDLMEQELDYIAKKLGK